jgi:hypothetical protein
MFTIMPVVAADKQQSENEFVDLMQITIDKLMRYFLAITIVLSCSACGMNNDAKNVKGSDDVKTAGIYNIE